MSLLADPFDHTDIQDIQCFFSSLRTWYGMVFSIPQCGALAEKRLLRVPDACGCVLVKAELIKSH